MSLNINRKLVLNYPHNTQCAHWLGVSRICTTLLEVTNAVFSHGGMPATPYLDETFIIGVGTDKVLDAGWQVSARAAVI